MARTLHIDGISCIKKRDPIGKDELDFYVSVDGGTEVFWTGPYLLDKSKNDDFVDLHQDKDFNTRISVRLKERDGDRGGKNDKDLGVKSFESSELSNGGEMSFDTDGVSYKVNYRITDED